MREKERERKKERGSENEHEKEKEGSAPLHFKIVFGVLLPPNLLKIKLISCSPDPSDPSSSMQKAKISNDKERIRESGKDRGKQTDIHTEAEDSRRAASASCFFSTFATVSWKERLFAYMWHIFLRAVWALTRPSSCAASKTYVNASLFRGECGRSKPSSNPNSPVSVVWSPSRLGLEAWCTMKCEFSRATSSCMASHCRGFATAAFVKPMPLMQVRAFQCHDLTKASPSDPRISKYGFTAPVTVLRLVV